MLLQASWKGLDFEVCSFEIYTVKIHKKATEGVERLTLSYGTIGTSDKPQDFWIGPKL